MKVSGYIAPAAWRWWRKGSQAIGMPSGVNYGTILQSGWPLLNDPGQIEFLSSVAGTGVDDTNNEGIWLGKVGDLALVASRGSQAPGTSNGVNFSDLQNPALNSAGQTAFRAVVTGNGVDSTNDRGIWASDWTGALQLIARAGDQLEVAPGDIRTLSDLNFVSASGNSDGRSSGFNNLGELAFWASFTDGSQGVFVSDKVAGLPGDFDRDGQLTAADIQAMLSALTDLNAYRTEKGLTSEALVVLGDLNGDHTFTNADIQPLLDLIASGNGSAPAVPEPSSIMLAALGMLCLVVRAREQKLNQAHR